jgi:hypothetical protein
VAQVAENIKPNKIARRPRQEKTINIAVACILVLFLDHLVEENFSGIKQSLALGVLILAS